MSSSFGTLFRVTTFGESHGAAVGAVVDGCPSRLAISVADLQRQLDRRRPGQSALTTPRDEADRVSILSGVQDGITLGTPIAMMVANADTRADDYSEMDRVPRPSHGDYTYLAKYGIRARSGGGRSSGRETIGRVLGGVVAESLLATLGVEIVAWVSAVSGHAAPEIDVARVTRAEVDATPVRCPDARAAVAMAACISEAAADHDSVGGTIDGIARNVPAGWGEPVFERLDARLAQAMLSIPACTAFELGSGFAGTRLRGSAHNDPFCLLDGRWATRSNHSGGVQGGISNGAFVRFRVAFKPTATIGKPQATIDYEGRPAMLEARGRHDPCVLPRAVPVVEAMVALVLADAALCQARLNPLAPVSGNQPG